MEELHCCVPALFLCWLPRCSRGVDGVSVASGHQPDAYASSLSPPPSRVPHDAIDPTPAPRDVTKVFHADSLPVGVPP